MPTYLSWLNVIARGIFTSVKNLSSLSRRVVRVEA